MDVAIDLDISSERVDYMNLELFLPRKTVYEFMKAFRRTAIAVYMGSMLLFCNFGTAYAASESDVVFQEMGGMEGINHIVDDFLKIILADERIKKQFADVDIKHLEQKLSEQFCQLSGGSCTYTGKDMKTIHADLGVTNAQFNALVEDLQLAMDRHGVSTHAQNRLLAKLAPMQHSIVTK